MITLLSAIGVALALLAPALAAKPLIFGTESRVAAESKSPEEARLVDSVVRIDIRNAVRSADGVTTYDPKQPCSASVIDPASLPQNLRAAAPPGCRWALLTAGHCHAPLLLGTKLYSIVRDGPGGLKTFAGLAATWIRPRAFVSAPSASAKERDQGIPSDWAIAFPDGCRNVPAGLRPLPVCGNEPDRQALPRRVAGFSSLAPRLPGTAVEPGAPKRDPGTSESNSSLTTLDRGSRLTLFDDADTERPLKGVRAAFKLSTAQTPGDKAAARIARGACTGDSGGALLAGTTRPCVAGVLTNVESDAVGDSPDPRFCGGDPIFVSMPDALLGVALTDLDRDLRSIALPKAVGTRPVRFGNLPPTPPDSKPAN